MKIAVSAPPGVASQSVLGLTASSARRTGTRRTTLRLCGWCAAAAMLTCASAAAWQKWLAFQADLALPYIRPLDTYAAYFDLSPVTVTFTAGGERVYWRTTREEVRTSPAIWRQMHLEHWNLIEEPLRSDALDNLLRRYAGVLFSPRAWDRMDAVAWDAIPQPVRTVAFRQMAAYWAGHYQLASQSGVSPALVADTLGAVMMSESWFNHRAVLVNRDGSMDIGLAGASEFARRRTAELYTAGRIDVDLSTSDFFDPWVSSRFLALWMSLMLDEADGDLNLAVRAYHRGTGAARDSLGDAYLATVHRRLHRFIQNREGPPAWSHVWRRGRELERQAWPWTSRHVGQPRSAGAGSQGLHLPGTLMRSAGR